MDITPKLANADIHHSLPRNGWLSGVAHLRREPNLPSSRTDTVAGNHDEWSLVLHLVLLSPLCN